MRVLFFIGEIATLIYIDSKQNKCYICDIIKSINIMKKLKVVLTVITETDIIIEEFERKFDQYVQEQLCVDGIYWENDYDENDTLCIEVDYEDLKVSEIKE